MTPYTYAYFDNGNLTFNYANDAYGTTAISADAWHHFVIAWNGSNTCKFYLDNSLVHTDTSCAQQYFRKMTLGRWKTSGYFDGSIASFKVFNSEVTSAEVSTMYNEEKSRFGL
jgi:hypothetical protein